MVIKVMILKIVVFKDVNATVNAINLQAEGTKDRLTTELKTLPEKTRAMKEELTTLTDLERLREQGQFSK